MPDPFGIINSVVSWILSIIGLQRKERPHPGIDINWWARDQNFNKRGDSVVVISPYLYDEPTIGVKVTVENYEPIPFIVDAIEVEVFSIDDRSNCGGAIWQGPREVTLTRSCQEVLEIPTRTFNTPLDTLPHAQKIRGIVRVYIVGLRKPIERPLPVE